MVTSVCLSAVAVLGTVASIVFIPEVRVKGKRIPVFWVIPFLVAVVLIIIGAPTMSEAFHGLTEDMFSMFHGRTSVNPVKILMLFFGMTAVSVFLDEAGVFRYLATRSAALAGHSQKKLFFILYAIVSLLTIFTSNDIIVLTFTPFIVYFCKNAKISPIPYLVSEFVAANTFSMLFIIGNPTNIYLAESYGLTFGAYFKVMAIPTVFGGCTALCVLYLLFRKKLSEPVSSDDFEVASIRDKANAVFGTILLVVCLVFLVVADYVGIEMWAVATVALILLVAGAFIVSAAEKRPPEALKNVFKRLPYELIPFVLSMFIIVLSLKRAGVADVIAQAFNSLGGEFDILTYGVASTLVANLINNIPMSVLFTAITEMSSPYAVFASVAGSNIGAFLTPVGALAGIMFTGLLKSLDVRYTFTDFIKYGVAVAVPTLCATLIGLYASYGLDCI